MTAARVVMLIVLTGASLGANAQVPDEKIASLTLSDTIRFATIDRAGDLYAVTATGQIQRFDQDGKLTLLYRADTVPTLFDPNAGARAFAYFRHKQQYRYFNPSFEVVESYEIDPAFAIQPWLICPSGERKLWMLDRADPSLRKVNVRESQVELEVVIDTALVHNVTAFTAMREYQNFVFLLNPQEGIFIFNSIGRPVRTIDAPGVRAFNFLGEELYYQKGSQIEFFNLFTAETRALQIPPGYSGALLTDERMILYTPDRIDIYPFRP